jgi:acetyltransferase-like isoleucine patch superfamily enzyme
MNKNRLIRRIKTAIANPLYVVEVLHERALTVIWGWVFRAECAVKGIAVGRNLESFGKCIIRKAPRTRIVIGDNVQIISSSWRSSTANCTNSKLRTFTEGATIIFEDFSGMTGGAIIARSKTIRIGKRCMLAPNVTILDSDWHIAWPPDRRHNTSETDIDKDVTLQNNVWVGMGVIILKGVTIGENSVIAAGSIVTSSIPPNCLAGGVPAKVLKKFDCNTNNSNLVTN